MVELKISLLGYLITQYVQKMKRIPSLDLTLGKKGSSFLHATLWEIEAHLRAYFTIGCLKVLMIISNGLKLIREFTFLKILSIISYKRKNVNFYVNLTIPQLGELIQQSWRKFFVLSVLMLLDLEHLESLKFPKMEIILMNLLLELLSFMEKHMEWIGNFDTF